MTAIFGLVLLALITAAFAYGVVKYMEEPMDGVMRNGAPGQFIELSEGTVHYRLEGPANGPLIVLVHGLTTPSFVFDAIVPPLNAKGFRTLRYDLFGRGFSDRPRGDYDETRYLRQLLELLEGLGLETPATFIGYSMGGAIATSLAAHHPDHVKRLVLVAPGGLGHDLGPFMEFCTKSKGLGDWLMHTAGGLVLRRAVDAASGPVAVHDFDEQVKEETFLRGYMHAVLSSIRAYLEVDQDSQHQAIARSDIPVLAIWGAQDPVIPIEASDRLAALNPSARQVIIEDADHDLPHRFPKEMLKPLLKG